MIVIILIVLIPVLVILISASMLSFIRAIIDRISFYKRVKEICKKKNYKITFPRKLSASFFRYSDNPDIIIETQSKNYLIRFITCKNKSLFYNFPTPKWYISFERILSSPINLTGRFKYLPPFNEKYKKVSGIENKYIMLFAPYIPQISYLNKKLSKRSEAGNMSSIDNWTIYGTKYFLEEL